MSSPDDGTASRPPPSLKEGEAIVRRYVSNVPAMAAMRRSALEWAWVSGVAIGIPLIAVLVFLAWSTGASLVPVVVVGVVVAAFGALRWGLPRAEYAEDISRPLPDIVYVTTQRVIVDSGLAWQSTTAMPFTIVKDVTVWQDRTRRRAGVAWVYLIPLGATAIEARGEGGELETAPGVIEIQNLPAADAQSLRTEVLQRARGVQASLETAGS